MEIESQVDLLVFNKLRTKKDKKKEVKTKVKIHDGEMEEMEEMVGENESFYIRANANLFLVYFSVLLLLLLLFFLNCVYCSRPTARVCV